MEKFETERIYLKLLEEYEITEEYLSWHSQEHTGYYSSSGKKFSKDFLLTEMREGKNNETLFVYGIYFKDNSKLIGNIKIGPIDKRHQISDLIVFIGDKTYLGKGLAVEAIKICNKVAFEQHNVRKLYGGMFKSNVGSVKAYTKAEWVIEGVLKAQYLVDGNPEDRILVACFNPNLYDLQKLSNNFLKFDDIYSK